MENSSKEEESSNQIQTSENFGEEASKENYEKLQVQYKKLLSDYDKLKLEDAESDKINKKLEEIEEKHKVIVNIFSKISDRN